MSSKVRLYHMKDPPFHHNLFKSRKYNYNKGHATYFHNAKYQHVSLNQILGNETLDQPFPVVEKQEEETSPNPPPQTLDIEIKNDVQEEEEEEEEYFPELFENDEEEDDGDDDYMSSMAREPVSSQPPVKRRRRRRRSQLSINTRNNKEQKLPAEYVGCSVKKYFPGFGWYTGVVFTHWESDEFGDQFRVNYSDGDTEDFSLSQLIPLIDEASSNDESVSSKKGLSKTVSGVQKIVCNKRAHKDKSKRYCSSCGICRYCEGGEFCQRKNYHGALPKSALEGSANNLTAKIEHLE